jgi:inner membrane protein
LDNLTHSLFGATIARTALSRAGRGTTIALIVASNAPDIDIVTTAGGAVKYLEWHRGMTHGPIGIVGLGAITAGLVWVGRRLYDQRTPRTSVGPDRTRATAAGRGPSDAAPEANASFGMLLAVSILGVLLHVLMDLPTSYGTRLLSPFDWHWFAVDWMPIVDIYLLMALVIGLLGRSTPAQQRAKAAFVLLVMATNYGVRAAAHHQALEVAPRLFGLTLPPRCDPDSSSGSIVDSWPAPGKFSPPPPGKRCLVTIVALPSFMSPFSWRIIAQMSNAYEIHDINLLDERSRDPESASAVPWRTTVRYPNVWTPLAERAAATHLGQVYLGFSRLPATRSAVDAKGITTIRWTDMRFAGGPSSIEERGSRAVPFTATIRVDADGRVVEEKLGR